MDLTSDVGNFLFIEFAPILNYFNIFKKPINYFFSDIN